MGHCFLIIIFIFASMKTRKIPALLLLLIVLPPIAKAQQIIFPDSAKWEVEEGKTLSFTTTTNNHARPVFSIEGASNLSIVYDTLGNFSWKPDFDLVDRLEKHKEFTFIFQALWKDGRKVRVSKTITVLHNNQPPRVDDLPVFYVKQGIESYYTISSSHVFDPDKDPIVFKPVSDKMPEGSTLTPAGLLTWKPSRTQFQNLTSPMTVEFIVEDQPSQAQTIGKLKIARTQLDLPPEMSFIPSDTLIEIKEDENVNCKILVSDPNGDEDFRTLNFMSSDSRIPKDCLKKNSTFQFEFIWMPGYNFVETGGKPRTTEIRFFAVDKNGNKSEKKIKVRVSDAENLAEKDRILFLKYKATLSQAKALIDHLNKNRDLLSKSYNKAKKGKKNRSIVNVGLGAMSGVSPVAIDDAKKSKVVSVVGGSATVGLNTLEATEAIGKSKTDLLDKIKTNDEIKKDLQLTGDNFARTYAIKLSRRSREFDADRDKFTPLISNPKLVFLNLDASRNANPVYSDKELKKTFGDYSEE